TGEMTQFDVIDWLPASEGEHLARASLSDDPSSPTPNIASDPAFVHEARAKAEAAGVVRSNLPDSADFGTEEPDAHAQPRARAQTPAARSPPRAPGRSRARGAACPSPSASASACRALSGSPAPALRGTSRPGSSGRCRPS